jgi:hypothetical protein
MQQTQSNSIRVSYVQIGAIGIAAVGLILGLIGAASNTDHFFQVYFLAFLFWLQIALGCLGLVLLLNVLSSPWGFTIRRIAEAGARTLPLLGVLFLPVLLGMERIFPWAKPGVVVEGNKGLFMTPGLFTLRAVIYFAIWIALAYLLTTWSYSQDRSSDPEAIRRRAHPIAILGIILYFLTTTFAAFDWMMSVEKGWFSSIIGWLFVSQQFLSAVPFVVLVLGTLWDRKPLAKIVTKQVLIDLGSLMLVGLLLWAYLSYIQYIVIWSGNLPEKIQWYVTRSAGGWEGFVIFMAIFHALIFLLLIIPGLKQSRGVLLGIAGGLLLLRFIETYWLIMPSMSDRFAPLWWDVTLVIAFGGAFAAVFTWSLNSNPLIPIKHPELPKALQEAVEDAQAQIAV